MEINGYNIIGELKTNNSGFSKWGFAKKNGQEYFIKEFLQPVYPPDGGALSPELIEKKRSICGSFVTKQMRIYRAINEMSDGSLVRIEHFFREKNKYYIVMKKIMAESWENVMSYSIEDRIRMCRILVRSINKMHKAGLIHGDIKINNILLEKTKTDHLTVRIIDFDDGFWKESPPENSDDVHGDFVYLAPETFLKMATGEGKLTPAIDVFALGIVLHQILSGEYPYYDLERYNYPFEALLDKECANHLVCSDIISDYFQDIINQMLEKDPGSRITLEEVEKKLFYAASNPVGDFPPINSFVETTGETQMKSQIKINFKTKSKKTVNNKENYFEVLKDC